MKGEGDLPPPVRVLARKTHLAADRTSCPKASANQFRLFLHAGAYWLLWSLRSLMPKRSQWRVAQFDTLRLRLIKIAARVVELKTHDPASPADGLPRPSHPAGRSRADPASGHMTHGAHTPLTRARPVPSTRKPHCSDRRPRTGAGQAMPATPHTPAPEAHLTRLRRDTVN